MFTDVNIVSYVVVSVVSFVLGAMSKVGYYRLMGRKIVLPFVSETGRNITALALVVGMVSVITVLTVSSSANRTAECNQQFREALAYNVMIGAEERDLNARRDALDSEYQRVLSNSITDLLTLPAGGRDGVLQMLAETSNRIISEKVTINDELKENATQRKPYPEPDCN